MWLWICVSSHTPAAVPRSQIRRLETNRKSALRRLLFAATTRSSAKLAYMQEFLRTMRKVSFDTLQQIEPLD